MNEQVSENGDFMEEIESFKDSLDQEYERRIAELIKARGNFEANPRDVRQENGILPRGAQRRRNNFASS